MRSITIWLGFSTHKPKQQNDRDRMGGRSVHKALGYEVQSLCYLSVQPHSPSLANLPPREQCWGLSHGPEHQLDKMLLMTEVTVTMDLTGYNQQWVVKPNSCSFLFLLSLLNHVPGCLMYLHHNIKTLSDISELNINWNQKHSLPLVLSKNIIFLKPQPKCFSLEMDWMTFSWPILFF